MISGDLTSLEAWLDARHGPGCFARLFRAPSFDAEPDWSGDAAPGGQAAQLRPGPPGDQQP